MATREGQAIRDKYKDAIEGVKIGIAEFLGTLFLVFWGCMGCISALHHHPMSSLQPALVFGFAVASIIQMFGHISKAHLNPAISVAALLLREITWKKTIIYVVAQCIGAVVGYGLLLLVTPKSVLKEDTGDYGFCTTNPSAAISTFQALLVEFIATSILIFVVCGSWDSKNAGNHDSLAIKFGILITALALACGPYTGASMNPARSLGPAFWTQEWANLWIYWVSPLAAGVVVSLFYRYVLQTPPEPTQDRDEVHAPLNSRSQQDLHPSCESKV